MTKRKPYTITVRRMATGCDYTARLFLVDSRLAFLAMAKKVQLVEGIKPEHLRLISVKED